MSRLITPKQLEKKKKELSRLKRKYTDLGKKVGEQVKIKISKGERELEILKIEILK